MSARLRRRSSIDTRRRGGVAAGLRRWTIPTIGALTPVGLIIVNIAVFIVHHLDQFRWTITVLAFVSSLMLNSWTALKIYRVIRSRRPDHSLLHDRNQEVVLVAGLAVIIAISFVTALFCYRGLSNERDLPNATTFVTGVVAILIPIALQAIFGRLTKRDHAASAERWEGELLPPPPPSPSRWAP